MISSSERKLRNTRIIGYSLRNKKDFNECYAFYNSGSLNIKAYTFTLLLIR